MSPGRLALLLVGVALALMVVAALASRSVEGSILTGLCFVFRAGGVLNCDRRGGH